MSLLRLRLEVRHSAIMREVAMPEDFTLAFLHEAIQSLFGWLDYHLHEFTDAKGIRYVDRDCDPPEDGLPYKFEDDVMMKKFFKKPGDTLDYEYDFGDSNEVLITLVGRVAQAMPKHFLTRGPDMVEDSAGVGGTEGVVEKLKSGSAKERKALASWLMGAFRKNPEQVVREPDVQEIFLRIYRLVKLVDIAEGNKRDFYYHDWYWTCLDGRWKFGIPVTAE